MKILVLAGGGGLRLWPYSTERLPKQFLRINGQESPFSQAITRALSMCGSEDIFISTNKTNFPHIKRQLRNTTIDLAHVLVKEEDYETGLSILLAVKQMKERFGVGDDDVVGVFPSDHFIKPLEEFQKVIQEAISAASKKHIVALGKKPQSPQEGFGYIAFEKKAEGEKFYRVERFVEKPPSAAAKELIEQGSCFWNLGMYFFPIGLIIKEFCDYFHIENINDLHMDDEAVVSASRLSFDKMISEHARNMVAVEAGFDWLDMGSWKAFYTISGKDQHENVNLGNHILLDVERSLALGFEKPIIAVHVDDLLIVDHDDALLIIPENRVDSLKQAIPLIREQYPNLMKGRPFVSVCTVSSDRERSVGVTVESVSQQSYPLVEHIIVDRDAPQKGGDLKKVVEAARSRFGTNGEKIIDIVGAIDRREGAHGNLNQALQESTGEIIGILNVGDTYADDTVLKTVVDTMEREGADVCWGDLLYVKEDDIKQMTRFWQSSPYQKDMFKKGWMPPHPTFFVRRHIYEKHGYFRTDMPVSAGYEYMLRVLEKEEVKSCYIPQIMVKMGSENGGGFSRIPKVVKGNLESYRAWKVNGLRVSPWFVLRKPLSKFGQLFTKSRSIK